MVSKKLKLLVTLLMLVSVSAIAQTEGANNGYMNGGYSIYDSSVVPSKKMGQQNEFWNNNYSFPAKPRNMWEVGVSTGIFTVSGDVSSRPFTAPNFGIHVRKALGYLFSLRLQYVNGIGKGMNWKGSNNFYKNDPWRNAGYFAPLRTQAGPIVNANATTTTTGNADYVFYNYKTKVQDLSLQGIFTLNNVRFHKAKTGFNIYVGAGFGASLYETKVNALNDGNGGGNYATLFRNVFNKYAATGESFYKNRKDILKELKNGMDDTYESAGQNNINRSGTRPKLGSNTLKPSGTLIAGVAFKLGKRINLAIEERFTLIKDDLLDGQQYQENPVGDAAETRDFDSYNYASVGLNFNLGGKSVEPLYWLNPLDYAYSELNTPKHMKLPKPSYEDADGDGVVDQLDREPNTPAGCPVDTHGVTKDTDGDGVPDCKDKQLITPTECQPVDADGIGKCPEPACCKNAVVVPPVTCPSDYPSLTFKGNVQTLSNDAKAMLATVASKLKANPTCSITVNGYPEASKASQAVCNKRNEAIKNYLVEKEGISADRISTNCEVGDGTNKNTVDIKSN
ncbi:OmpA family protein [Ferruginibacter yonginensis]|uniref:OmpA family protein n=1 Tax=Ferruginibacter yonginensis TaxID=1310416 RepID=A0ABV8QQ11_9BACT